MFCAKCGTEGVEGASFCGKCGADLKKQTPPIKKFSQDSLDGLGTSIQQELDADSFKVGILFANRYEILSEGKRGGMGVVYKCKDTMLNGKIKALKVIHPRLLSSPHALSRFRQEVAISQELNHENIVRVYDIEEWEGKEYFTMEWVEGVSLREIITGRKREKRPFSIEDAYKIISQLADALHHAHRLTIHRDIKPENILISSEAGQKVKLTDFGIAKMLSPSQFTSTSIQMGTPYYMAPEQKVDAANVDKRADIYALGVVLFELLTLENTIGLELPSEINKNLPKSIDNIIKKALATRPEDRFADVLELADALDRAVGGDFWQAEKGKPETGPHEFEEERSTEARIKEGRKDPLQGKSFTSRKVFVAVAFIVIICGSILVYYIRQGKLPEQPFTPETPIAPSPFVGTLYASGHGGHFAKAKLAIDPNDTAEPIKINQLDMISIGTTVTHKTQDVRVDSNDMDTLLWATYALDQNGKVHIGKTDLKTGNVIRDIAITPDPRAPGRTGPLYKASGQSRNYYMPVFMGIEGYIDIIDKRTLESKHKVFISDLGYRPGSYQFVHGTNSCDMKKFLITVTMRAEDGKMNGKQDVILVDLPSLENGKFRVLARTTLPGEPGRTVTFRMSFSKDDKYIFQSAGDRLWVMDAVTLRLVDEKMTKPAFGEVHDAIPTSDGNYVVLALRTKVMGNNSEITDGGFVLYDFMRKRLIGKPVSACFACHKNMGVGDKNSVLGGIDVVWRR